MSLLNFLKLHSKTVKTRFAPSPTGLLHIGGLRTALYSFLIAKQKQGKFILRIEDTDQARFVSGAMENIISTLEEFNLKPDEGFVNNDKNEIVEIGKFAPYQQSHRKEIYQKHVNKLLDSGHAYYCFCSTERLNNLREQQIAKKQAPGYDGHCRNLSPETINNNLANSLPYVIRFKTPKDKIITFSDSVRGVVEFNSNNIDDQVLLKSDGLPTYHLAVVVDDHLMKITHVIRGEEWLPSTPKHVMLYQSFGWEIPNYIHLPLLLNKDRSKLSKRTGDVAVKDYLARGYLSEAIINFIALLGWSPTTDREFFSLNELIDNFNIAQINKSGAIFDIDKLNWFNLQYGQMLSLDEYFAKAQKWLEQYRPELKNKFTVQIAKAAQTRVNCFSDIPMIFSHIFNDITYSTDLLIFKKSDKDKSLLGLKEALNILTSTKASGWTEEAIQLKLTNLVKERQLTNGDVFWPIRVALSGAERSESPVELIIELGKEKVIERISKAISNLQNK